MALSPCTRFAILGCGNNTARMYDVISGAWEGLGRLPQPAIGCGLPRRRGSLHNARASLASAVASLNAQPSDPCAAPPPAGQCMGVMAGHTGWVHLVRFLPDGKRAVTASHDGTARSAGGA